MDAIEAAAQTRAFALSLPGTTEEFPWEERVIKVNGKVFAFLGRDIDLATDGFGMSVKLPTSGASALELPNAKPTGYGLGKSGWVSLRWRPEEEPPIDRIRAWVEESYRAVAQKRMVARLDAERGRPG